MSREYRAPQWTLENNLCPICGSECERTAKYCGIEANFREGETTPYKIIYPNGRVLYFRSGELVAYKVKHSNGRVEYLRVRN